MSGLFDAEGTEMPAPPPEAEFPSAEMPTAPVSFSADELAAVQDLRAAGRELELAYRQYTEAKERHQRALGHLHRIWSAESGA